MHKTLSPELLTELHAAREAFSRRNSSSGLGTRELVVISVRVTAAECAVAQEMYPVEWSGAHEMRRLELRKMMLFSLGLEHDGPAPDRPDTSP